MTMYAVYVTSTGELVSVGSVVASPLPATLSTYAMTRAQELALLTGESAWDAPTRSLVDRPVDVAVANEATIQSQIATALTANTTYLAIGSPTNAQVVAQVRALTQQTNKLIRLTIRDLISTT